MIAYSFDDNGQGELDINLGILHSFVSAQVFPEEPRLE